MGQGGPGASAPDGRVDDVRRRAPACWRSGPRPLAGAEGGETASTRSARPRFPRKVWINLSTAGFDNQTASFVVGACAVSLASGPNGTGRLYPYSLSPSCAEFSQLE